MKRSCNQRVTDLGAYVVPLAMLAVGSMAGSMAVAGSKAAAQTVSEDRSQSFKAVQGAVKEDVPGGPLLVAAYGLIFMALLAYVMRLVRLQGRAQRDLERLTRLLSRTP